MQILFAASSEFALPSLRALLESRHKVVQIYSQPDRPAGRGRQLTPTPISQFALRESLPLIRTADLNAEKLPPADLLVVIAFGQKIAPHVVNHARLGSVNLHGSILPRWRGAGPIHWAILGGDRETGNSVIRLAQKMDAGAILGQSRTPIGQLETTGELHDRLAADGAPLLLRVIDELEGGIARETAQDESLVTHAKKLTRELARLDFNKPAEEVARWIRGLAPWPGCHVKLTDEGRRELAHLTLLRAQPMQQTPQEHPATTGGQNSGEKVGSIDSAGRVYCGGNSLLEILELQPEGKKPMPLAAFRNGHRWHAGMRLEPL